MGFGNLTCILDGDGGGECLDEQTDEDDEEELESSESVINLGD